MQGVGQKRECWKEKRRRRRRQTTREPRKEVRSLTALMRAPSVDRAHRVRHFRCLEISRCRGAGVWRREGRGFQSALLSNQLPYVISLGTDKTAMDFCDRGKSDVPGTLHTWIERPRFPSSTLRCSLHRTPMPTRGLSRKLGLLGVGMVGSPRSGSGQSEVGDGLLAHVHTERRKMRGACSQRFLNGTWRGTNEWIGGLGKFVLTLWGLERYHISASEHMCERRRWMLRPLCASGW